MATDYTAAVKQGAIAIPCSGHSADDGGNRLKEGSGRRWGHAVPPPV